MSTKQGQGDVGRGETRPRKNNRERVNAISGVLPVDVSLVENTQKGLHSSGNHRGRFMIDEARGPTLEHAEHQFRSMMANALDFLTV